MHDHCFFKFVVKRMLNPEIERQAQWLADPAGVQQAVVEGLYLLAQVGATPADATALFTEDLGALGRMSPAYLGQVRGVLERLVVERPIPEAQAFLSLLVQARGI